MKVRSDKKRAMPSLRDATRSLLPVCPWRPVGKGTAGVAIAKNYLQSNKIFHTF
jgi:hypothetical protein